MYFEFFLHGYFLTVDTSDAENKPGPSSEQPVPAPAPPPPDEPWISTDEEDDKAHVSYLHLPYMKVFFLLDRIMQQLSKS